MGLNFLHTWTDSKCGERVPRTYFTLFIPRTVNYLQNLTEHKKTHSSTVMYFIPN